jgi:hypothetical protein
MVAGNDQSLDRQFHYSGTTWWRGCYLWTITAVQCRYNDFPIIFPLHIGNNRVIDFCCFINYEPADVVDFYLLSKTLSLLSILLGF